MLQPDSTPALEPALSFSHKIATAMPPNVPHLLHVEPRQAHERRSKLNPENRTPFLLTPLTSFDVAISNTTR
jgi:hypothetical protein